MDNSVGGFARTIVFITRRHLASFLVCVVFLTGLTAACSREVAVEPSQGVFPLRAVRTERGESIPVPASVPGYGKDAVRILGGGFELGPDHSWRERWERVLVYDGIEGERRVFESGGKYRVTKVSAVGLILDLYPNQVIPANISPTAVLRGDTLFHSAFIFVR